MTTILYWILATLTFISELLLWFSAGRVVWLGMEERFPRTAIFLGILSSLALVILWALFMAPKADRRLPMPLRALMTGIACLAVGYALYRLGDHTLGMIMMISVMIVGVAGQIILESALIR